MAFIFDLFFSHSPRVAFMAQNVVMIILLVIDLMDNLIEALGPNGRIVPHRSDRQPLSE